MIAKLSKVAFQALKILKQPTAEVESGTVYARPSTPYFVYSSGETQDNVQIVVNCPIRYGSFYGDSDHWDIREVFAIPTTEFYKVLEKLEPGIEISAEVEGEIIKTDCAWGVDCENPHDFVIHQEVQILFYIGISEDLKKNNSQSIS